MNLINYLGIGTVTATKETNTDEVMVYLPSMSPSADGRAVATVTTIEKKSKNAYDEETTSTSLSSNSFPAKWGPMGDTNRITPPDVREGSKVAIYQVDGQNTYYWTTFGVNSDTMRLETVIYGFQANPAMGEDTPFNIDNFYTFTVSTHEGFFALRTTQANGEKAAFEIKLDAMNGKIMVGGSHKNYMVMDDVQRSYTYVNADKSVINVDRKKITFSAEDSITARGLEQFNILTKVFNLECEKIAIKANTAEIRIGKTKWIGEINQTGDYIQTGDFRQQGDYTQRGNMTQTGNITSTGIIKGLTGVTTLLNSLDLHFHGGVDNGNGSTMPPTPGTGV